MRKRLALICLLLLSTAASAREKITWILYPAFPPARIVSGPLAGQGIIDRQLSWLMSQLKDFDHRVVEANNARAFREIAEHDGQCAIDVLQTPERSEIALFSRVALIHYPPGLIVRNDRLRGLDPARTAEGAIDLDKLARIGGLSAAVAQDRQFGPAIGRFLASDDVKPTPVIDVQQALTMIVRGHADYTFGYFSEELYYRRVANPEADVTFLPIAEGPAFLPVYIACSRGAIGERAIETINHVLAGESGPAPYLSDLEDWFDPEEYRRINDPATWRSAEGVTQSMR